MSQPAHVSLSQKSQKYVGVCQNSRDSHEKNDCSVKAVAMVGQVSYADAHKHCASRGRVVGGGMWDYQITKTLNEMGFDVREVKNLYQKNGSQYTLKTIGKRLNDGQFIAYTVDHVVPVINGTVFDVIPLGRNRITDAFEITRKS